MDASCNTSISSRIADMQRQREAFEARMAAPAENVAAWSALRFKVEQTHFKASDDVPPDLADFRSALAA